MNRRELIKSSLGGLALAGLGVGGKATGAIVAPTVGKLVSANSGGSSVIGRGVIHFKTEIVDEMLEMEGPVYAKSESGYNVPMNSITALIGKANDRTLWGAFPPGSLILKNMLATERHEPLRFLYVFDYRSDGTDAGSFPRADFSILWPGDSRPEEIRARLTVKMWASGPMIGDTPLAGATVVYPPKDMPAVIIGHWTD